MAHFDQSWGPVPGGPATVEEFYPIEGNTLTWFPKNAPGQWGLKVGAFDFALKGSAYDPMKGWGMDVNEFVRSEWEYGRVSFLHIPAVLLR